MRLYLAVGVLLSGSWGVHPVSAQAADPNVLREVEAVRTAVASNTAALGQYTWTEHTEVRVKDDVKSSDDAACRYDLAGKVTRTPLDPAKKGKRATANSNNPRTRKKAEIEDYIERAISLTQDYVPLKPDQVQALLRRGTASVGQSADGRSQIRFENYFQTGDSLVFTYDPVSKAMIRASIKANMGSPKDPVTLEAVFDTLPDGVNHLASTTLNAEKKKVQVTTRNDTYQKVAN
jgi:hypothetical protein